MTDDNASNSASRQSAIQALRTFMTLDGDELLSIGKTAWQDGPKGWVTRGISVLQRLNERRFGQALLDEVEEMRRAGKIREDFPETDSGASTFREFLEMIGDKPDEERFRVFCALFMSANAPDADTNQAIFDLELMRTLRNLSPGEMHLLFGLMKMKTYVIEDGRDGLMAPLAEILGYNSPTLVNRNVIALLNQGLIRRDTWENQGGNVGSERQLVTDLGLELSKRVEAYNKFKSAS